MASSLCQVKIGAGAYAPVSGGINVSVGDVVTIKLASSTGVNAGSWSIACTSTDETKTPAAINALLTTNPLTFEATFTVGAGTGQALLFASEINAAGIKTRTTFGLYVLVNGLRVGAPDETLEGNATFGWVTKVNALIRASAGGTQPITLDTASTGAVNNYALGASTTTLRFSNVGGVNLSGLTGGTDNRRLIIINATGTSMTLYHDATSTLANRILCGTGANLALNANVCIELVYDATTSRWRTIGYM